MKARISFKLFVCILAATCLVGAGCKKKPVNPTPLPNAKVGNPTDIGPTGPVSGNQPPITGTSFNPNGPNAYAAGPGHQGWIDDRETLKTETVYFDFDSSTIKGKEKSKIETVASYLKQHGSAAVKVEGNCDERGTEEYNRALGERRALAIREYLINSGITPATVDTVSYGEDKPVDPGHNEAAWKKNRRGDFVLLTAPK